ncbi:MAG: threonine aldolase family protein [Pirellulaceae bacterium]|jgi:threonine aldolase
MAEASSWIDLRSDTVTRPTPAMRQAIAEAEVGDDVIDVDPTIERLQARTAEILGKEAAIFMPSGSMTNQIAIRVHCQPGDEFLCEEQCHVYNYEQAAFAQLSGLVARTIPGKYGVLHLDQLRGMIRPEGDHLVRTRLVCLENTHNRGGGTVWPYQQLVDICQWARDNQLKTHLDGARLFNAEAASGIAAIEWSQHFDSVSICFSKGLGAPVGSALAGSKPFIQAARRARKLFGGGMRQAGVLAAAALYALEHHRERLVEDHQNAQKLADAVARCNALTCDPARIDSNIVIVQVDPRRGTAKQLVEQLREHGVLAMPFGPQSIRMVTHLDLSSSQIDRACAVIERIGQHR